MKSKPGEKKQMQLHDIVHKSTFFGWLGGMQMTQCRRQDPVQCARVKMQAFHEEMMVNILCQ